MKNSLQGTVDIPKVVVNGSIIGGSPTILEAGVVTTPQGSATYLVRVSGYDDAGAASFVDSADSVGGVLARALRRKAVVLVGSGEGLSPASVLTDRYGRLVLTFDGVDYRRHEVVFSQGETGWSIYQQRSWLYGGVTSDDLAAIEERLDVVEANMVMAVPDND